MIRALAETCKRAGLPLISAHGLRHSWATAAAYEPEIARPTVRLVGRWKDDRTLDRVYTHVLPEEAASVVEQLAVVPK